MGKSPGSYLAFHSLTGVEQSTGVELYLGAAELRVEKLKAAQGTDCPFKFKPAAAAAVKWTLGQECTLVVVRKCGDLCTSGIIGFNSVYRLCKAI